MPKTESKIRERRMALAFALGSACFLVGPFPGYASLVGERGDAITFFAGTDAPFSPVMLKA